MTYPGNSALSADAQQRILGTFDQTLELAQNGSRQEALLGCDFVLRMDPHFEPALRLQDRLKASAGPVAVADLKALAAGEPGSAGASGELHDLSHLAAELPDLDDLDAGLPELPPEPGAKAAHELRARFSQLLAVRRYDELLAAVERESATVLADPELGHLAEMAHQRMEAEPYVRKFLDKVREATARGDRAEAERLLDKARALDPTHPGIAELQAPHTAPAAPTPLIAATAPTAPIPAAVPSPPTSPAPPIPPTPLNTALAPENLGFALDEQELPEALKPNVAPAPSAFGGDSESERRIRQLLDEGQAALDGGDPQAAIDAWSRIFLIDIDHHEAARRIEAARKVKAENERQVEEVFHDGLARLEAGDLPAARRAFERVLELQPSYLTAREYLQQLDAGEVPVVAPALASGAPPMRDATAEGPAFALPPLDTGSAELTEEILVPPEPSAAPAPGRRQKREPAGPAPEGAPPKRASRTFLYVGGGVLALVLAVVAFVYLKRDEYFPNSRDETAAVVQKPNQIARATALHKQGKNAIAIAQLRRLQPSDPQYQEAQKLIAEWEAPAPAATPAVVPVSPEAAEHRLHLIADARQASAEGNFLKASSQLEAAGQIAKLEGAEADDMARAKHELEPFATQIDAFKQHEWEYVLPALWRLHEANPANRDITRLIVDSYYDLGVRDLQRVDPTQAAARFQEGLKLDPNDADLKRHYLFAQTYQERPPDLLFRIYVKYLPLR
jgi:tetratricopeptide (TPR) repeat protein